ncbi:hypothetical protein ACT4R9_11245 [Ornithobacterium rhinotracheale]|uniref:hypothetical protein n=1 Tax=Ornithobacterium rhinotracheale TaxID=28251 RepID=UPI003FA434B1
MKLLSLMLIKKLFPNNVVDFLSVIPSVFFVMGGYSILFILIYNSIFKNDSKNLFYEPLLKAIRLSLSIITLTLIYVNIFSNLSDSNFKKELFFATFGVGNSIKTFLFGSSFFAHSDFFDISLYIITIAIISDIIHSISFYFLKKYRKKNSGI